MATSLEDLLTFHNIEQVILKYASTIDLKDWEGLRSILTEDAVTIPAFAPRTQGRDEVVKLAQSHTTDEDFSQHMFSVYHIELDGPDRANALTYCYSTANFEPDEVRMAVGRSFDKLRLEDGNWKIAEKRMDVGWSETRTRPLGTV